MFRSQCASAPPRAGRLSRADIVFYTFMTCSVLNGAAAKAATPVIEAHYSLSTMDGTQVDEHSYQGKWQLIYFGFASCPDVCSTVMQQVAGATNELGSVSTQIQPLFITLDPVHDSPAHLSSYLSQFDQRIVGLRGSKRQTLEATKAFRMYFKTNMPVGGDETIDHSSFLFLLKPDGSFSSLLSGNTAGHALASELRRRLQ